MGSFLPVFNRQRSSPPLPIFSVSLSPFSILDREGPLPLPQTKLSLSTLSPSSSSTQTKEKRRSSPSSLSSRKRFLVSDSPDLVFIARTQRIPEADLEEKAKYLTHWMDSHVMDGENVLKKPILFTEVGSSLHMKKEGGYDRDLLLKMVYDKIYESAKKKQAGTGALIWQLIVEGTKDYGDRFSLVAWDHPSTYKLILEQSCRLRYIFHSDKTNRKLYHTDPCFHLIS